VVRCLKHAVFQNSQRVSENTHMLMPYTATEDCLWFICSSCIQVHASAQNLRLITFDADGTLYADGCHMEQDNKMIDAMIELMAKQIHVAIVTAAGYPGEPELFQRRIPGLLTAFQERQLPKDVTDRFLLLGGECNYLLRSALPKSMTIA
jgi:hypothetical protein